MRLKIGAALLAALMLVGAAVAFAQAEPEADRLAVVEGVQVLEDTLEITKHAPGWSVSAPMANNALSGYSVVVRNWEDGECSGYANRLADGTHDVCAELSGTDVVIGIYRVTLGS